MLLDTHALLWWLLDSPELSLTARQAIADPDRRVLVSAASAWELATKFRIGKLPQAEDIVVNLAVNGCQETLFSGFEGAVPGIDGRLDRGVPVLGRPEGGQARGRGQLRGKAVG